MSWKDFKQHIIYYVALVIVVVMGAYAIYVACKTIYDTMDKRSELRHLEREIESLESKNYRDSLFIHQMLHSPQAAEEYIREVYHMQRQGEIVYFIEE